MNYPIDVSNTVLHTPRLTLRPWRLRDLDDLFAYARDPEVGPNAGWAAHPSRDHSVPILLRFITEKKTFAIEYEGKVVGSVGIENYNEKLLPQPDALRCREIGFVLSRECWGMGLMTEAVRGVIRFLFEDVGLDAVVCGHFLRNARSARVQEKCGFRPCALSYIRTAAGRYEAEMMRVLTKRNHLEKA